MHDAMPSPTPQAAATPADYRFSFARGAFSRRARPASTTDDQADARHRRDEQVASRNVIDTEPATRGEARHVDSRANAHGRAEKPAITSRALAAPLRLRRYRRRSRRLNQPAGHGASSQRYCRHDTAAPQLSTA